MKWGKGILIHSDSGGKVNILGGDSVSHCARKVRMAMFVILNGYRDRDFRFYNFKIFVNDNKGENVVPLICSY